MTDPTLHELVMIFDKASKEAAPGDEVAGNPMVWPVTRGVAAVAAALREARQQEREMVEGEIVRWLREQAAQASRTLTGGNTWETLLASANSIERGDWKHSAGTGE